MLGLTVLNKFENNWKGIFAPLSMILTNFTEYINLDLCHKSFNQFTYQQRIYLILQLKWNCKIRITLDTYLKLVLVQYDLLHLAHLEYAKEPD